MSYAIVFSSLTGNTQMLAETIQNALPKEECLYFGKPDAKALKADRIYVGSWTDKGRCSDEIVEFFTQVTNQEIFLFGTAGFGGGDAYFNQILNKVKEYIPETASIVGSYMCQGKMPMSVRQRYEKMAKSPKPIPNMEKMIENFDKALSHPNQEDLDKLQAIIKNEK